MSLLYAIIDFIQLGGPVLWLLFVTCLLLWLMILERLWFFYITWPHQVIQLHRQWRQRIDRHSWPAQKIRDAIVSESTLLLHTLLPVIRVLIILCPLLGLLGTVLGMISVFEVIAVSGNDDAQAMAQGIYRATIPTMAGLVVALTGIFFNIRLHQIANRASSQLKDALPLQGAES
ncbi:MAG: MotA/TolQ/ExbB proton channel family protein [Parahaliea sp.]